jgi:glucan endo-1,3-alpha-glucosidase
MQAAHAAGIDGFALNIGPNDHYTMPQLRQAYSAASSLFGGRFVLFLMFDMAAGEWPVEQVVACINEFKDSPAQCRVRGLPLVSTFEGPQWAENWPAVREATGGIYLVPDWSSLGPHGVGERLNLIDGACEFWLNCSLRIMPSKYQSIPWALSLLKADDICLTGFT